MGCKKSETQEKECDYSIEFVCFVIIKEHLHIENWREIEIPDEMVHVILC